MASRVGTLIISPIRIQDDTIQNPVAFVNELQGGAQSISTLVGMYSIPGWLRQFGMFCTVYNDGNNNGTYILTYGLTSTNLTDNGNWKLFAGTNTGTGNAKKLDQPILNNGSINLPANCLMLLILVNAAAALASVQIGYSPGADDLVMSQPMTIGYNNFFKGIFLPAATTIYFAGITTQSTCSVIVLTF